jgi:predicted dehydrogenase
MVEDNICFCLSYRFRQPHAVLALEAGLHCLIEKPFATSTADARAIVGLASAAE